MDSVHEPESRSWISKPLTVSKYFSDYICELEKTKPKKWSRNEGCKDSKLADAIGITKESTLEKLKETCSISRLFIPGQPKPLSFSGENSKLFLDNRLPDENGSLKTNAVIRALSKNGSFLLQERSRCRQRQSLSWFESLPPKSSRSNQYLLHREILLVVRVYRPVKHDANTPATISNFRYSQELYFLGSSKLSELRDSINCSLDYSTLQDVSENPFNDNNLKIGKEKYKSGFLFINNCFYNDTRWHECNDLSATITDWASDPCRGLGPFTTASLENTRFVDLTLRLGYPYVYVHQGEHEHLFSFIDIRLLSPHDPQKPSQYPYERSVGYKRGKYCMVCTMFLAKWMTCDNERVPEDPYFFCTHCFKEFNYNEEGGKIGNFKAYKYVDMAAL